MRLFDRTILSYVVHRANEIRINFSVSLLNIDRVTCEDRTIITNCLFHSCLNIAFGIDLAEGPILPPIVNNWIVLLDRFDGSLDFNRSWDEYRNGFGNIGRGEFWLGNEKIHRLTNKFFYTLRVEVFETVFGHFPSDISPSGLFPRMNSLK